MNGVYDAPNYNLNLVQVVFYLSHRTLEGKVRSFFLRMVSETGKAYPRCRISTYPK